MLKKRIIPTLLLKGLGLAKGVNFKNHQYVGDAINAVRIFNEKKADEIILLDIEASSKGISIDADFVQNVADECYMPFGVGGGITSIEQIRKLVRSGAEKVVLNTSALIRPNLISEAASEFGNQCIVVAIDYRKDLLGFCKVYSHSGKRKTNWKPSDWAKKVVDLGAGEILLTSIEKEGRGEGYDLNMIRNVAELVPVPIIAAGGAGNPEHFSQAFHVGASAAAAGSMFVFQGPLRSVLIQYYY